MTKGQSDIEEFPSEINLESINAVTIASCAIQQLPKLFTAMGNMARRTRRQLHRRGVILGGHWLDESSPHRLTTGSQAGDAQAPKKLKGILKNSNQPSVDQLSEYNDFWKVYFFSFQCPLAHRCVHRSRSLKAFYCNNQSNDNHRAHPVFAGQLCTQNCQRGLYQPQTQLFMESFPVYLTCMQYLQSIQLRHLQRLKLSIEEEKILAQLQYLKILFNTPLHKLVRERPKEYIVPLPRRFSRAPAVGTTKPYYARSLTNFQTVLALPNPDNTFKWLSLSNLALGSKNSFFGVTGEYDQFKTRRSTVPKGVAFITYPDSVDETSFEGTIGDRNLISWEKGTKFPQMGIDQTTEFKYKKEMGRQHMIQSRLRAARIYRRIYCDNWNNYVKGNKQGVYQSCIKKTVKKTKGGHMKLGRSGGSSLFKSWFKLAQLKQSLKALNDTMKARGTAGGSSNILENASTDANGIVKANPKEVKTVRQAKRKRRIRNSIMRIIKFVSCGLVTYCLKGECRPVKRRRLRTSDSTERCATPPAQLVLESETVPQVSYVIRKNVVFENLPPGNDVMIANI